MTEIDRRPQGEFALSVSHVLETSLYVTDLDVSHAFYQKVLCLKLVFKDARMCALAVPGDGVLLLFKHGCSLEGSVTPGGIIPPHGGKGMLHVCFAIPLASLSQWSNHLTNCSVEIESRVTQYYGGTSLYFRDPDFHSVELAIPGLWPNY